MMLTINEAARMTGLSAYEIRRRIHNGTIPHMRVGAKQTKILINEDVFINLLREESLSNIICKHNNISDDDSSDTVGYGKLRRIN